MLIGFLGFIAMLSSTLCLVPQIVHTLKSKSVGDLSGLMLANYVICSVSWVIYGLLISARAVWITNLISTGFSAFLFYLKLRYAKKNRDQLA
ncbi:MAG: hypothetical protein H7A40_02005 [Chlamydiales bacterium]|nr:hypothetical protein [Chlamydiales bacterium]